MMSDSCVHCPGCGHRLQECVGMGTDEKVKFRDAAGEEYFIWGCNTFTAFS